MNVDTMDLECTIVLQSKMKLELIAVVSYVSNTRFSENLYGAILDFKCNETDVRLVGGETPHEGLVEICLNGVWGSVCGYSWLARDASVVCRQLGYNGCKFLLAPTSL